MAINAKPAVALCILATLCACGGAPAPTALPQPTNVPVAIATATPQPKPTDAPTTKPTPASTPTPDKKVWTKEDLLDKEGNLKIDSTIQYLKESGFPNIKVGYDREGVVTGTDKIRIVVVSTEPGDYLIDVYDRAAELLGNAMRKLETMPSFAGLKDEHGNVIAGTRVFFQISGPTSKLVKEKLELVGIDGLVQDSKIDIYLTKIAKCILLTDTYKDYTTGQNKSKVDGVIFNYPRLMWNVAAKRPNARDVEFELGITNLTQLSGSKVMKNLGPQFGY